jgi:hypothetical protein
MYLVAETDLITWHEKIDLVEPEAAEQISHCYVFLATWKYCISNILTLISICYAREYWRNRVIHTSHIWFHHFKMHESVGSSVLLHV